MLGKEINTTAKHRHTILKNYIDIMYSVFILRVFLLR